MVPPPPDESTTSQALPLAPTPPPDPQGGKESVGSIAVASVPDTVDAANYVERHQGAYQESYDPPTDPWRGPISVSRAVLYAMGGLIVAVAVCSFLLGWGMAKTTGPMQFGATKSHRIHGRVTYATGGGRLVPDTQSVVIALPRRKKPDEKFGVESIRPDKVIANGQGPTVMGIRAIGGDFALTDPDGDYELEVNASGEYYLLILSSHVARSANRPPMTTEIVELGQYFRQANVLLGKNDYVWAKHIVRADKQFNTTFER